jgi:hypothetical protein
MSVEDRVRTATRERAALVRDIRPLDLPVSRPFRSLTASQARRWLAWAAPVTAAAVVVALAIALVAVRQMRNEPPVPAPTPPVAATGATLPDYYAVLDDPSGTAFSDPPPGKSVGTTRVIVGDRSTGGRLGVLGPPKGETFVGVTGSADGRTYILAAASAPLPEGNLSASPVGWYLLRVAQGSGDRVRLTRLSIPGQPAGTAVSGIALSPDGSQLAVMFQNGTYGINAETGPLTLRIYSVPSGRVVRTWNAATKFPAGYGWYWGRVSNSSITWLADGHTLAFDYGVLTGENGPPLGGVFSPQSIRTLDLARPGHALLADSKVVLSIKGRSIPECNTLQITADGKAAFCGRDGGNWVQRSAANDPEVFEYSIATGKPRLVYRFTGAWELGVADVLWASPTGSTLVISVLAETSWSRSVIGYQNTGILTKGTFKPLAFPSSTVAPLAGEIAF